MLKTTFLLPIFRGAGGARKFIRSSLSRRLLVSTIIFVVVSEVFILAPVIAKYRFDWLHNHIEQAQIAALGVDAAVQHSITSRVGDEMLDNAGVLAVILHRSNGNVITLARGGELPQHVDETFDLHNTDLGTLLYDAFSAYMRADGRVISLIETPHFNAGTSIEVIMSETPMRHILIYEGVRVFWLSLTVLVPATLFSTTLLYFIFVRPMRRITASMVAFREDPSDARNVISVSPRTDEIGVAERELNLMQARIRDTLTQNARLAALGKAVSKINHDLRNILSNAQLLSDRIGAVDDPTVRMLGPRLFASIDRAIALCTQTLRYGRADDRAPRRELFSLQVLVDEVRDSMSIPADGSLAWETDIDKVIEVDGDREHVYRILCNLARNALQAMEAAREGRGSIRISAQKVADHVHIDIVDTGPGLAEKAKAHLFEAFAGGTKADGFGLGLAIADELARSHGGHIDLIASSDKGAHFRLCIPATNSVADCEGRISRI